MRKEGDWHNPETSPRNSWGRPWHIFRGDDKLPQQKQEGPQVLREKMQLSCPQTAGSSHNRSRWKALWTRENQYAEIPRESRRCPKSSRWDSLLTCADDNCHSQRGLYALHFLNSAFWWETGCSAEQWGQTCSKVSTGYKFDATWGNYLVLRSVHPLWYNVPVWMEWHLTQKYISKDRSKRQVRKKWFMPPDSQKAKFTYFLGFPLYWEHGNKGILSPCP